MTTASDFHNTTVGKSDCVGEFNFKFQYLCAYTYIYIDVGLFKCLTPLL